jgi:hypothetical protein
MATLRTHRQGTKLLPAIAWGLELLHLRSRPIASIARIPYLCFGFVILKPTSCQTSTGLQWAEDRPRAQGGGLVSACMMSLPTTRSSIRSLVLDNDYHALSV